MSLPGSMIARGADPVPSMPPDAGCAPCGDRAHCRLIGWCWRRRFGCSTRAKLPEVEPSLSGWAPPSRAVPILRHGMRKGRQGQRWRFEDLAAIAARPLNKPVPILAGLIQLVPVGEVEDVQMLGTSVLGVRLRVRHATVDSIRNHFISGCRAQIECDDVGYRLAAVDLTAGGLAGLPISLLPYFTVRAVS